jgi:chemotaxis signal transduction protein
MTAPYNLEQRLRSFRHAFDHTFAAAPLTTVEAFEDLLAIRLAGDAYALRLCEIRGLVASRKIVSLPSRRPELLGLAGIRGSLVAVYDLAALLGYRADSKPPSWLALAGASESIGLGFEAFEGFLRVRSADVHDAQLAERATSHVGKVVRVEKQSRRVVDIPSTLRTLALPASMGGPPKDS